MRTALTANPQVVIDLADDEMFVMAHPMANAAHQIMVSGATVTPTHVYVTATRVVGPGQTGARAGFIIDHGDAMQASFPDSFKAVILAAVLELRSVAAYLSGVRIVPRPLEEPDS